MWINTHPPNLANAKIHRVTMDGLMDEDLSATMPAVQMTMSAFVLGFGVAQLLWGPVADRFGRRPVLQV